MRFSCSCQFSLSSSRSHFLMIAVNIFSQSLTLFDHVNFYGLSGFSSSSFCDNTFLLFRQPQFLRSRSLFYFLHPLSKINPLSLSLSPRALLAFLWSLLLKKKSKSRQPFKKPKVQAQAHTPSQKITITFPLSY